MLAAEYMQDEREKDKAKKERIIALYLQVAKRGLIAVIVRPWRDSRSERI
jgi:hypothetical protein